MDQKLDDFLVKRYPEIFKDRHGDMSKTCMCWGFSCGDGWFHILNKACALIDGHIKHIKNENKDIEEYIKKINAGEKVYDWVQKKYDAGELKINPVPYFIASQVKEKFGTLRFYYSGGDSFIDGVIRMAEAMSSTTCEECGDIGEINGKGYVSTKCNKHKQTQKDEVKVKIDDYILALREGEQIEVIITSIINEKEVIAKIVKESDWDCDNNIEIPSEIDDKKYLVKYIENNMFSYWNLETFIV